MRLRCVTPPATAPVTLAQAREHLSLPAPEFVAGAAAENAQIESMIAAAVAWLDGRDGVLGRALEAQVWEMELDGFPAGEIAIPLGPVVEIGAVEWIDALGVAHDLGGPAWRLLRDRARAWLRPVDGWPAGAETVTVRWTAGEGCPAPVHRAVLMLVAHFWANREAVAVGGASAAAQVEMPMGVAMLIENWRVIPL